MITAEVAAAARVIRLGKLVLKYNRRASWTGAYLYSDGVRADAARLYREAEAHLIEMLPGVESLLSPEDQS